MKVLITTLALGLFAVLPVTASDKNNKNTPAIIAIQKSTSVAFNPNLINPSTINAQEKVQQYEVTSAGASFIKVHFKQFTIPDGAYVLVSNAAGTESYRYDNQSNSLRTFNSSKGENGVNQFSAMSVFGDTAIVKLVIPVDVEWLPSHNINIDSYNAGTENDMAINSSDFINSLPVINNSAIGTESTCGVNERKDVKCWASSNPVEFERTRPVARLLMAGSGLCTGWRVGSGNHMFTNNHCLETNGKLQDTEIWFNYQHLSCDGSTLDSVVKVSGNTLFKTDFNLDYSLFSVNSFASIASFGYFGLEVRGPIEGEQIYIPQHGAGNPKELSIESDQNSGGLCQVDTASANGRVTGTDMGYFCDTTGGSSGSPVLASSSNNVIALHHFGGCENQGVRIDKIWPQVASIFGNTIPVGDNEPGDNNQPPVAIISFSCNELSCSFSGADSSDTDGDIIDYQWSLGDGSTDMGAQIQHNYNSAGSYNVSLTVSDNGGLSHTTSQTVAVTGTVDNALMSGVPITGLADARSNERVFYIDTTEANTQVNVQMNGGSGDADLYVRKGDVPTKSSYDCRPYKNGNSETCDVQLNSPGRVYVKLIAYSNYSGVSLVATNIVSTPSDFPKTGLNAPSGDWLRYSYTPASSQNTTVSISGGSGDADLYINTGSEPSTSSYLCRPYLNGNNESCSVQLSAGEAVYIGVRAYTSFSGVTLEVTP